MTNKLVSEVWGQIHKSEAVLGSWAGRHEIPRMLLPNVPSGQGRDVAAVACPTGLPAA